MQKLEQIVRDTNILILSDEVYEHILYDGLQHESVLRYPNLKERSAAVYSFGKTYHATGWKMGYVIAPDWWTTEIRKMHQFVTFGTSTPVQYGLADFISDPKNYNYVPQFYQQKRDLFCAGINNTKFTQSPSAGTYFQLVDYSAISDLTDTEFCNAITKLGVAAIPLSPFYENPPEHRLARFCFAKNDETLQRALELLADFERV